MLDQSYVLMSINTFNVVLYMSEALSIKIKTVNFVRLLQMKLLLQTFILEKSLS